MEFDKVCFVIMPFGVKEVSVPPGVAIPAEEEGKGKKGKKKKKKDKKKKKKDKKKKLKGGTIKVDFDAVYRDVFEPAIAAVDLPEGGKLEPRRTDMDAFAGDITQDMFEYLVNSRFALADITGANPNVFYELGVRHATQESGTAIFRLPFALIPFDISHIKIFPYESSPEKAIKKARELITEVLRNSLERNHIDSPVRIALRAAREDKKPAPAADDALREAENAAARKDWPTALAGYKKALAAREDDPLLHFRLGLLYKDAGQPEHAAEHFGRSVELLPEHAEAHRELGVVRNLMARKKDAPAGLPDGEADLRRAVELNPSDFDALAALGGVLKRKGKLDEALEMYRRSADASLGHPYPLLNALKLEAAATGALDLGKKTRRKLARAESFRRAQVAEDPPVDAPWSFFDLAEIQLYLGNEDEFRAIVERGLDHAVDWQVESFRSSLRQLQDAGVELPGLAEGLKLLED